MLFPIRDNQPTIRKPHFTIGLIVVNTIVFLFSQTLSANAYFAFLGSFGYIPVLFLDGGVTYQAPAWLYATPITSMFMHGGWMHLIGNMVFLWIYGNNIEDYFGPVRFLLFYLASGLVAILLYTLPNTGSATPLVGASGAIAGVMGAYIVLHPRAKITCLLFFIFIQFVTLRARTVLGLWFAYQVIMSLFGSSTGGGVAWLAHIGGFLFGWGLMKLLVKFRGRGITPGDYQRVHRMHW